MRGINLRLLRSGKIQYATGVELHTVPRIGALHPAGQFILFAAVANL